MRTFSVRLTEQQYADLNARFPLGARSSGIGKRAVEILKIHFLERDPACAFQHEVHGADLEVVFSNGDVERIEVKGTVDTSIAWEKLKVSGKPSFSALKGGMPLYRVCAVESISVTVYVMKCPEDFEIVPEDRWRVIRNAI